MTKYTTNQGDTWDMISFKCFGSELFVSNFIELNYQYREIAVFSAGVVLQVPQIDRQIRNSALLPPWSRAK